MLFITSSQFFLIITCKEYPHFGGIKTKANVYLKINEIQERHLLKAKLSSPDNLIPLETHFKIAHSLRVEREREEGKPWSHRGEEEQLRAFCQGPRL